MATAKQTGKTVKKATKQSAKESAGVIIELNSEFITLTPEQRQIFEKSYKIWDDAVRPYEDELRKSETLTDEDYAIRVNVRDYD